MTKRVLVTGGDGFVGSPAVAELQSRGFEVHVVARHAANDAGAEHHPADLLDAAAVTEVLRSVEPTHLLHLAWCTEPGEFWDDPANDAWAAASLRMAEAFFSAGGTRLVFGGTCAQYDWSDHALAPDGVAHERSTARAPATRYGRAKERVVAELGDTIAAGLVFFPYGPHEKPARLVPTVTNALLGGEPVPITSGTQVRDFLHVDDCGRAFAALVDSDVVGLVNIGSGTGTAIVDVARTIATIVGRDDLLRVGALPDRPDEPPSLVADVTRLTDEVGFQPRYDLVTGLGESVEWWRQRARRR